MAQKKGKVEINWDEETEKKVESKISEWAKSCGKKDRGTAAGAGAIYCLGLIGSAIYYIQTATGFWDGVVGVLKAIVWPGFLIYELMQFLGL